MPRTTARAPPAAALLLLLSDLHLGRGTRDETRRAERDAVALLRAHRGAVADGGALVLLGDVYDQFLEYRHLVPKAAPRLVGLLAEWADAGLEVVYCVGNRDPWHVDFFERDVGVSVVRGAWERRWGGRALYIAHGDRYDAAGRLASRLLPLLRDPRMARLYRMALPGDAGFGLARWVARTFGSDGAADPPTATRLEAAARARLEASDADLVALGHSHVHALVPTPHGTYLNPGYWFGARTFATVEGGRAALHRWADGASTRLALEAGPRAPAGPRPHALA